MPIRFYCVASIGYHRASLKYQLAAKVGELGTDALPLGMIDLFMEGG
jgi:hypothetical protein